MILLNKNFVYRKIHNVHFLVPIRKNDICDDTIFLNETAALVFQLYNQAKNAHELAVKASSNFIDADENEVISDLESYIQDLIKEGLLIER